jgi:hypothetical protein
MADFPDFDFGLSADPIFAAWGGFTAVEDAGFFSRFAAFDFFAPPDLPEDFPEASNFFIESKMLSLAKLPGDFDFRFERAFVAAGALTARTGSAAADADGDGLAVSTTADDSLVVVCV